MDHDFGLGKLAFHLQQGFPAEFNVGVTISPPEGHGASGLLHHPGAQILVRHKKDVAIGRAGIHDLHRVSARADDVAERLHLGAAVDVGDGQKIRVGLLQFPEFVSRAAFLERASGALVRQNHDLVRAEDLGGLRHEMNAAEDDDIRLRARRLLGEPQGIPDKIGHILNFRHLVVVGQNHSIQLFLQDEDLPG